MQSEIPLLLAIERLAHDDNDRLVHEVRVGIGGRAERPLTVEIESDFFELPRVREVICDGDFDLPERLRDLLIFKVFEVLSPEIEDGATGVEWPVYDARAWIETFFLTAEAGILLSEFRRFIEPGKVIDWRVGSMYVPVRTSDLSGKVEP